MDIIDVSEFKEVGFQEINTSFLLVVKSLNQIERRESMIQRLKNSEEKIGRLEKREIEKGLLVEVTIDGENSDSKIVNSFREPRHIKYHDGFYYLTEVGSVLKLDTSFKVVDEYKHDFFAFLHTIDIKQNKMLIVSSGYDCLIEIDLGTKEVTWEWFAWENGFNPDGDGEYLVRKRELEKAYQAQGLKTFFVDPKEHSEYGLITSKRSAHPNVALYNPYNENSILVSIALNGEIYEINRQDDTLQSRKTFDKMTHGLYSYGDGWIITNTTKGEFIYCDKDFTVLKKVQFANLSGKDKALGNIEWIQQVMPYKEFLFVLDANRNLFIVNLEAKTYSRYPLDPNWCLQDILILS